jgi:hypothetical protein
MPPRITQGFEEVLMLKTLTATAAAALGIMLLAGSIDTALAKKGGGGGGGGKAYSGGGRSSSGGMRAYSGAGASKFQGYKHHGHKHHGHKHHHHRRVIVGVPYAVYGYSYGCNWLYQRAVVTGSRYWWSRYHACTDGYYYD